MDTLIRAEGNNTLVFAHSEGNACFTAEIRQEMETTR